MSLISFDSTKTKKSVRLNLKPLSVSSQFKPNLNKIEIDYIHRATRKIKNKDLKQIDNIDSNYKSSSLKSFDSYDSFLSSSLNSPKRLPLRNISNLDPHHHHTPITTFAPVSSTLSSSYATYVKPNASLIDSRLTILDKMKCLEVLNRKLRMVNVVNKSIMRDKQPILFQSMHVDKWLNVFVHPQNKEAIEQMHARLFENEVNETKNKKVLIKSKLKSLDYTDILRQLNRIETNNGFNLVVNRIKEFLDKNEEENENKIKPKKLNKNNNIVVSYKNLRNNTTLGQNFKQIGFRALK